MFKKLLQSLSKPHIRTPAPSPQPVAPGGVLSKVVKPAAPMAAPVRPKTAEDACEITSRMSKDQIHARLKLLYRRYNRAASSLNPKTRAEADDMLDAIVLVREKHFGEI